MLGSTCFFLAFCLLFWTNIINGLIEPLLSGTPYVEVGGTLKFSCRTNRDMEWVRGGHVIHAQFDNRYEIHTLYKEPQGIVESTLFKHDVRLNDRGDYMCRDKLHENDYHFYATVIYISASAVYQGTGGKLRLICRVSGFESVVPQIQYEWQYKGKPIVSDSERHVSQLNDGLLHLEISQPNQNDNGPYQCRFSFLGQTFMKRLNVQINELPPAPNCAKRVASNRKIAWFLLTAVAAFINWQL